MAFGSNPVWFPKPKPMLLQMFLSCTKILRPENLHKSENLRLILPSVFSQSGSQRTDPYNTNNLKPRIFISNGWTFPDKKKTNHKQTTFVQKSLSAWSLGFPEIPRKPVLWMGKLSLVRTRWGGHWKIRIISGIINRVRISYTENRNHSHTAVFLALHNFSIQFVTSA